LSPPDATAAAEALTGAQRCAAFYNFPMSEVLDMAAVAALVGDPARANILCALMDGRAFTAGELAYAAHVSPQTASGHLGKLKGAQLIASSPQGRHRYYRLAGPHVAAMLESIMAVAAIAPPRRRPIRIDDDMRNARLCYDHVAGRLGVGLADALRARDHLELSHEGAALTASGEAFLHEFGVDVETARHSRRIFCRPCIDWSERRPHLAGAVGAALAQRLLALRWIARVRDGRALVITPAGRRNLEQTFGILLPELQVRGARPLVAVSA
jgi:DNA-binding transcriptional ArsR family regulator